MRLQSASRKRCQSCQPTPVSFTGLERPNASPPANPLPVSLHDVSLSHFLAFPLSSFASFTFRTFGLQLQGHIVVLVLVSVLFFFPTLFGADNILPAAIENRAAVGNHLRPKANSPHRSF